jgi:hypothetical protein
MENVGIFYGHFVYFVVYLMVIWYIFTRIDILYKENSGNPALNLCMYSDANFFTVQLSCIPYELFRLNFPPNVWRIIM